MDEPKLAQSVIALLGEKNDRDRSMTTNFTEAIVVEAVLALSGQQRQHVYVFEIAAEANRLLQLRGEQVTLSPEKVGRRLRKLGLRARRLTRHGKGLLLDKVSVASIEQIAVMYVEEDLLANAENLPCPQATEKKKLMEVM